MAYDIMEVMAESLGLFAGTLGVVIAIWLQLVMARKCRPRYVMGFFILGSCLILLNLEILGVGSLPTTFPKIFAYIALIIGQVWTALRVYEESEAEDFKEAISQLSVTDKRKQNR